MCKYSLGFLTPLPPRVVVDALEGVDEARDARFVECLQRVDLPPGGEGDSVLHGGIRGEASEGQG